MLTVKQLKKLLNSLPEDMEIRGANHFTDGEELNIEMFNQSKKHLSIEYYAPQDPDTTY